MASYASSSLALNLTAPKTHPAALAFQNFTTQWFLIPQGTGILAVILHQLHYRFDGLTDISIIFFFLTVVLLLGFLLVYILRLLFHPRHVLSALSHDISETAYLSSICISYTTIIQMIALTKPSWGETVFVLWWINVALATLLCIAVPFVFMKFERPGLENVPPGIFLPLVAALTAAAGGGVIARYAQLSHAQEVPVIIVSYLLVGMGLPLAISLDAVFLARLFDESFPKGPKAYQLMLLAGPLGQGSFALIILGKCLRLSSGFGGQLPSSALRIMGFASQFAGLITWGYGCFWWAFALLAIAQQVVRKPKEMGDAWSQSLVAWSLVFPWGVYTNACSQLGVLFSSRAFNVLAVILTIALVVLWLINAATTIVGVISGKVLGLNQGWRRWYP